MSVVMGDGLAFTDPVRLPVTEEFLYPVQDPDTLLGITPVPSACVPIPDVPLNVIPVPNAPPNGIPVPDAPLQVPTSNVTLPNMLLVPVWQLVVAVIEGEGTHVVEET